MTPLDDWGPTARPAPGVEHPGGSGDDWPPDDPGSDAYPDGPGFDPHPDDPAAPDPAPRAPRGPLLTPLRVTLALALLGSLAMIGYGLFARDDTQLRVLTAGGFVAGIVLALLAVAGAYAAYRRAAARQEGRAFAYALLGGLAAVLAALAFASASILAMVQRD